MLDNLPANPTGIGASILRKEDRRFLTGRGNYVADLKRPGMTFGVFVRSPHAHASLGAIDTEAARVVPGVLAVLTGADLAADEVGGIPCGWGITGRDGQPMKEPAHPALALGKVRYVGDAVAFVVAETAEAARQAADVVEVAYDVLPSVVNVLDAVRPDAPVLFDEAPGNLCCDWEMGDRAAVDAAFAGAAHVARLSLVNNRLVGNPMEPRAAVAEYDPAGDRTTLWTTSQFPHVVRLLMGNFVLKIPQHKLRVVAPDVGGGFGVKQFHYAEEAVVTWAARRLGRAVKWVCERSEGFISDAHGRDHVTEAEMALDETGKFLALRVSTLANMGGYLSTFGPNIPTNLYAPLLAGVYTTPAIHCEVKCVFTNTVPVDAYRGAGRPEATFVLERLVDVCAAELGMDRIAIRRRNMITADAYPYQTPVMVQYDSGDPVGCMDRALEIADWAGFPARREAAARRGVYRGIGISTYIEACGLAPSRIAIRLGARGGLYESAAIRVHPTGHVTALMGTHSHGQGHETTFAQIVSEKLGVPVENVDIVFGDTDRVQFGMGTYGSRSLVVGGTALSKAADKIILKGRKIAAHQMEAAIDDVVFEGGTFRVAGTDRTRSFEEISLSAYVPADFPLEILEPGLEEQAFYDPVNFTYPGGAHIAEVEIDRETGSVRLVSYVAVDDVGTVINPMIVAGQLHGGIVQGVGQALCENAAYDEGSGQLVAGSFMDYCMPRADMMPRMHVETHNTRCSHTDLGTKGCGEMGTIGSPAAVTNAIVNALSGLGITHVDMPASPNRIWRVMQTAQLPQAAE
ncbi:xanthine dehydrogenase family protein molybdopterin-binding subunit [Acidisphaera rubrifaciens]|uniref:Carbon monoxide dehydrogenase/molybdopterin binding aldehyde oxidase n=1 Tax=Acidisphaera rubrifaciens HS-AP3 TaxID=1231350 RepID=A0A0D6P7F7_9PROT|nr:xanthine dehydrogenase family protein molybdopterin-binding subunit [Acidisphaera rubrifaciens]GAN77128.1 carbon monoxide dehydrogenase/molybdopterin binding aldehyde oxidase [Acidisphaera rubrifaciens HS-AP3]